MAREVDVTSTADERAAMVRAFELARRGPEHDPNPRVGCVLLRPAGAADPDGASGAVPGPRTIGEGWHQGAGTAHASPVVTGPRGSSEVMPSPPSGGRRARRRPR